MPEDPRLAIQRILAASRLEESAGDGGEPVADVSAAEALAALVHLVGASIRCGAFPPGVALAIFS